MRREGRPHGMVRTYHALPAPFNPKPASRIANPLDIPPTAGLFTKVSNKPSNHSKFTGKCEKVRCTECHLHPAWKAKVKSKGSQKLKTSNADVDYRQVSWRVMGLNKLCNNGYSASGILDELNIYYHHHNDLVHDDDNHDDYDYDYDDYDDHVDQEKREILVETIHDHNVNDDDVDVIVKDDDEDDVIIHVGVTDDGDDGYMGFYDVAYVLNHVDEDEEEGWSVVGGDKI